MPMRVIAKKRCRAMFEPPDKGEPATLNPNLSTRLLLFFDQALGRRVGYCWSRLHRHVGFVPTADSCTATINGLFDDLVGSGKQRGWER